MAYASGATHRGVAVLHASLAQTRTAGGVAKTAPGPVQLFLIHTQADALATPRALLSWAPAEMKTYYAPFILLSVLAGCFYPPIQKPLPARTSRVTVALPYDLAWDAVHAV